MIFIRLPIKIYFEGIIIVEKYTFIEEKNNIL